MNEIGGQAKAMIATSSRLQAVQFRLSVDKWISENGFEFKALVAFTDSVPFDGEEYTEHGMNGVNDDQTANEFEKPESRILIVANKYQTGFDQPLLHTMYVDKKLGGVAAVQTLRALTDTMNSKPILASLISLTKPKQFKRLFNRIMKERIWNETSILSKFTH